MSIQEGESRSEALRALIAAVPADFASAGDDYQRVRERMAPFHGAPTAADTEISRRSLGGVPVAWVCTPEGREQRRALLFCHGGAFVSCDLDAYLFYAEIIARELAARVLLVDYRLAPEHPWPAALDDCMAVYRELLALGQNPSRLGLIGDSCGGGLALATLHRARAEGLPQPACLIGLSAWLDLEPPVDAIPEPFINADWMRARARDYLGSQGRIEDPFASPGRGDATGLPALYFSVGETDITRSAAQAFVDRAEAGGGEAVLDVAAGGVHGFQGLVNSAVPEATDAWRRLRQWTDRHLPAASVGCI